MNRIQYASFPTFLVGSSKLAEDSRTRVPVCGKEMPPEGNRVAQAAVAETCNSDSRVESEALMKGRNPVVKCWSVHEHVCIIPYTLHTL